MILRMARRIAYKKKGQNRFGMFLAASVIIMMLVAVAVKNVELKQTLVGYDERKRQLTEQIAAEEKKAEEIVEYEKYTQTKKYIEEVAKDKLGLVYDNEIIFRDED